MLSTLFIALVAKATLVAGRTPDGFSPNSNADLMVVYGQTAAMNGAVVDKGATASAPTIASKSRLDGTSYAVIVVDLDIPSNQNPHTFLHWMQTDLAPATTASSIAVSNGTTQGFTLSNAKRTSALVPYTQPNPPAQNPLSHRYTQILIDTSSMTQAGLSALQSAAQTRVGFDTASVLEAAGLSNNVVAGNFFNVTNPGQTVSSASFSNFSSTSIGDSTGNIQGSGQVPKTDNEGFKGFGATGGGDGIMGGGTLTTTISSAPAGPTSGLTQAGTSGGATSAASKTCGGKPGYPLAFMVAVGFLVAHSSSL